MSSLYFNYLSGNLPPELENLTQLKMFSVYGNDLLGPIPSFLSGLPSSGYGLIGWDDD